MSERLTHSLRFRVTAGLMIPIVLAIFITAVVAPAVDCQVRRWRFPNWLAVLTTSNTLPS